MPQLAAAAQPTAKETIEMQAIKRATKAEKMAELIQEIKPGHVFVFVAAVSVVGLALHVLNLWTLAKIDARTSKDNCRATLKDFDTEIAIDKLADTTGLPPSVLKDLKRLNKTLDTEGQPSDRS